MSSHNNCNNLEGRYNEIALMTVFGECLKEKDKRRNLIGESVTTSMDMREPCQA